MFVLAVYFARFSLDVVFLNPRARESRSVLVHHLSEKQTKNPFRKLQGIPVSVAFHQKKKIFFVATKKFVRVYDLESQRMIKKLETGCREVSSISLHSTGK